MHDDKLQQLQIRRIFTLRCTAQYISLALIEMNTLQGGRHHDAFVIFEVILKSVRLLLRHLQTP